jgi:hypothetical protein
MSSVHSYIKQQNIIYGSPVANVALYNFTATAATVPAVGSFVLTTVAVDSSAVTTPIFRDMGEVIVSAGRTFRRVQQLTNLSTTYGVAGDADTGLTESQYRTYYAEMSMINGKGVISNLYKIQG